MESCKECGASWSGPGEIHQHTCSRSRSVNARQTDARRLHDKLIRSYLFTLNKGGPTESDLSSHEVDLILLALTQAATHEQKA